MRKRNHVMAIYLNDKELGDLKKRLRLSGLSFQAYACHALLDKTIAERPCEHHGELLAALSNISNGVNEILRRSRAGDALTDEDAAMLRKLITDAWHIVSERY